MLGKFKLHITRSQFRPVTLRSLLVLVHGETVAKDRVKCSRQSCSHLRMRFWDRMDGTGKWVL